MNETDYAKIVIDIIAPEEKVNSSEELKLSDELYQVECDLVEWLKKRLVSTPFGYRTRIK
jgi:hypothetical protein